jgi:hypothetical protein
MVCAFGKKARSVKAKSIYLTIMYVNKYYLRSKNISLFSKANLAI